VSTPPDEDPWAAGRASTAAEVKDIFTRHRAPGPATEHHDALPAFVRLPRFLLGKLPPRRRRAVLLGLVAGAVLLAGAIWVAHEAANRAQLREARAEAGFRAGELQRLTADQRARTARVGALTGPALTRRLQDAVGADARARVRTGALSGPIRRTVCRQGNGLVNHGDDPDSFLCFAVTSSAAGVTLGHEFFVRVNRSRGVAVWCHNNYPPAHPETQKAISAPVSRACTGR
jgi:hypothetical protein